MVEDKYLASVALGTTIVITVRQCLYLIFHLADLYNLYLHQLVAI